MPTTNFSKTSTDTIITGKTGKHIKILGFWFELSADATMVSFRWTVGPQKDEDHFPRTTTGLSAMNLVGIGHKFLGAEGAGLNIYIDGTVTVRGTIIYELI